MTRGSQAPGELESALRAQGEVDQDDVRPAFVDPPDRLGDASRDADDGQPLALEQAAGRLEEPGAVIDDDAAQAHRTSVPHAATGAHSG